MGTNDFRGEPCHLCNGFHDVFKSCPRAPVRQEEAGAAPREVLKNYCDHIETVIRDPAAVRATIQHLRAYADSLAVATHGQRREPSGEAIRAAIDTDPGWNRPVWERTSRSLAAAYAVDLAHGQPARGPGQELIDDLAMEPRLAAMQKIARETGGPVHLELERAFCRALIPEGADVIQRVTSRFIGLRAALAASGAGPHEDAVQTVVRVLWRAYQPEEYETGSPPSENDDPAGYWITARNIVRALGAGVPPAERDDVDELANIIRTLDGSNDLGAELLAERLVELGYRRGSTPEASPEEER